MTTENDELDAKIIALDTKRAEPRIKLIPFEKITLSSECRYLVKGLVPRVGLSVVWGPPKCGKSFWALDLALHVALGWPYRGRRVQAGPVVYGAFEGGHGFDARITAFKQKHLEAHTKRVPFFLEKMTLNLVRDHVELIQVIKANDTCPSLVVLDTLNRSLQGSENSDEDMGAYVRAADAIREAFHCAVLIVHHCGVDGTRPRGHTSLTGAVDVQLACKRDALGNVMLTVEHMKDGPEGDKLFSRLESVTVGTDQDGDAITSCVIVPVEGTDLSMPKGKQLSSSARVAIEALANCILERGEPSPPVLALPADIKVVMLDTWKEELFSKGVLDRDATNPRENFRRIKVALQSHHLIGLADPWVWLAKQGAPPR